MPEVNYPLDPTGQLQTNRIVDEPHTLTSINATTYRILIPKVAPFHTDNLRVVYIDLLGQEMELVDNVDYQLCLPYLGASRSIGKMIYGGISINREDLNGSLRVTYQTLGGEWTADSGLVLERIMEMAYNPRITIWDVVTNKPNQFPPINHDQEFDYVFGHGDLIEKLDELKDAVLTGPNAANIMMRHIFFDSNPHNIDKNVVGLSDVENIGLATDQQVLAHELVDKHVTLRQIVQYLSGSGGMGGFSTFANTLLDTSEEETLGNVLIASLQEVLDKESIKKYVTLDTLVDAGYLYTLRDILKNIDKSTVGLGDVNNIGTATDKEALDREPVEKYVTLRQLVELGLLSGGLDQVSGTVDRPSIVQPLDMSTVARTFSVTTTPFNSTYEGDTHIESEFKAIKNSAPQEAIIVNITEGDLTKCTFSDLDPSSVYQLSVRYRSARGGWTQESQTITLETSDGISLAEQAKLIPNVYSYSEHFGHDVVISDDGNTAVICDDSDKEHGTRSGAVHVFVKVDGYWNYQSKLSPTDIAHQSYFGSSVDISGDGNTIAVGARLSKSVYVFTRAGNGWVQTAKLKSGDYMSDEGFGSVVRINKDATVIAVGAPKAQSHLEVTGSVYLFEKSGNNWYMSKKVYAHDSKEGDLFGSSISISDDGNALLVGASKHDLDDISSTGTAYLFSRDVEWEEIQKFTTSNKLAGDLFGSSVDISGDSSVIVIGAEGAMNNDGSTGAVYVFKLIEGVWTEVGNIIPVGVSVKYFGNTVKLSEHGSVLVVGAKGARSGEGEVHVLHLDTDEYTSTQTLVTDEVFTGSGFGTSVDISRDGSNVIVGMPGVNFRTSSFGSAYIFNAV